MAKFKEGSVDSDTLLAIQNGNDEVKKEIKKDLATAVQDIKDYIDLKNTPIEKDVERLRHDVSDLYEKDRSMRDRVGVLEQRQSNDEGNRSGRDIAGEHGNRKSELTLGKAALFFTAIGLLMGAISYFIP